MSYGEIIIMNRVILSPGYFPDATIGRPVSNGKIYVGLPDINPEDVEANQKQVTIQQENGDIVEIPQPITLSGGGLPQYNGSVVTMFVEGDYSLKVLNKKDEQEYYIPSTNTNIGDSLYFNTIADLRVQTGTNEGQTATVLGYYTIGDGGAGPLRYWTQGHPPSTYVDDGGSVIIPNGGDGSAAWLMGGDSGTVIPEWWGAVGDGLTESPTDDTLAVKNAIIYADGKKVYLSRNYLTAIALTNEKVNITGGGSLTQRSGSNEALAIIRTPGDDIAISSISDVNFPGANLIDYTKTQKITPVSVANIDSGDVFLLSSSDKYIWDNTVNKAEMFKVLRFGLSFTNGSLNYGDIVTGNTSGAIFTVLSSTTTDITFSSFNNIDIINGEDLYVLGVKEAEADGLIYLLPSQNLADTYTNDVVINNVPKIKIVYKSGLTANGNIDDIVGSENRRAGIRIDGGYNPIIKAVSISSWRAGVRLNSCWQGDINVSIEKLSNDANVSESAFGYGVRLDASTHGTNVQLQGSYARHGITSNTIGNVTTNIWLYGTTKYVNVHDSQMIGSFSSAFDTHPGAYFWTFVNCIATGVSSLAMTSTSNIGFNNRGFGTEFVNCIARQCTVGFNDLNLSLESGFDYNSRYVNCLADNYGYRGFLVDSFPASVQRGKIYYSFCEAMADNTIPYNDPFVQNGFQYSHSLVEVEYNSCISRRSNAANFRIGNGKVVLRNVLIDMTDSLGANVESIRIDNDVADVTIDGLTVIPDTTTNEPESLIRYNGSADTTIKVSGSISCPGAKETPIIRDTNTGVSELEFTSVGEQDVVVTTASNLTNTQVIGTTLTNFGMSAITETELHPYNGRTSMLLVVETAGQTWRLEPPAGEAFLLDGTLLDANDEILCGNVAGDSASLVRYKTGASTYRWALYTIQGTFTDVGP